VNPARLSAERQAEICMQCHLETTSFRLPNAIVRYERGPFSYRPGEPLGDFILQFDKAGGNDRFEIASAAYRMRRSACFLKTGGELRCTTCHNPHDIRKDQDTIKHYAEACRQCHAASFQRLVTSGKHPASENCIDCHMPKRRTSDVIHVVMTDHYIQRRPPAIDLLRTVTEIHETDTNAYHGEVAPYYPADLSQSTSDGLYLAIAQVSQRSNLRQGIEQLAAAIARKPPDRIESYLHLADAYLDAGQPEKAIPAYEEALQRWPDSYAGLRKLGSALRSSGQLSRAIEVLKKAAAIAPDDGPSWNELGLSYLGLGMKADALTAFQKAAELDPDLAEAENSLGGIFFENADLARAETAFREAIRIQPDYAEARSNLGNLLSASGRFDEARYQFDTAIRLKPDYAAARRNYAVALAGARKFVEAQRQIQEELRIEPNSAAAHDLLGSIQMAGGNVKGALEHYREAVRISPEFGRAQLDLGEALAASGNIPEALPYLERAAHSADRRVQQEAQQTLDQFQPRR
jgi:tetratricopeptide (TPR) repeat protein